MDCNTIITLTVFDIGVEFWFHITCNFIRAFYNVDYGMSNGATTTIIMAILII
jgi:hypothetical protein